MTLKQRNILNLLDIIAVLFAAIEIAVIATIVKYDTNNNMKTLFIIIGIICFISIIKSINCILNKQK